MSTATNSELLGVPLKQQAAVVPAVSVCLFKIRQVSKRPRCGQNQKANWNLPFKGKSQNSQIAKIQANTCKFMPTFAHRSGVPSSVSSEILRKYAKEKHPCNLPTGVGPSPVSSEPKNSNLTKNRPQTPRLSKLSWHLESLLLQEIQYKRQSHSTQLLRSLHVPSSHKLKTVSTFQ